MVHLQSKDHSLSSAAKSILVKSAIALAASCLIAFLIHSVVEPQAGLVRINWFARPVDFLVPSWFYLAALLPYFFVVRTLSLTDVSDFQQYLSTGFRCVIVMGIAAALARPTWSNTDNKVATVVLVDVSDSVSDAQLASSREYAAEVIASKGASNQVYLVSFAERPYLLADGKPESIQRHPGGGAGTNIQAAIQLAYGIYPDGYLPRMVVVSDGNQTHGDLLSESYRAEEMQIPVSFKTFETGRTKEVRVASLRVPDEIKVGDNDTLSAWVSYLIGADVLIILTDVDGLYDADPRIESAARHIAVVDDIGSVRELGVGRRAPPAGGLGTGGIGTKLGAAKIAADAGIATIMLGGGGAGLLRIASGAQHGTLFVAGKQRPTRKAWIGNQPRRGTLDVDLGAARALRAGRSLLPRGVVAVAGEFGFGDALAVRHDGHTVAVGLSNYASSEMALIKGRHSSEIAALLGAEHYDEVIHRDNLLLVRTR